MSSSSALPPTATGAPSSAAPPGGAAGAPPGFPPVPAEWATQDRGPQLIAVFWTQVAVASIFIATRFYSRITIRSLGVDDYMMLVSYFAFIASSAIMTDISSLGGFRHLMFVPLENATEVALKNLIAQAVTVFAYGTSKFSVGYLMLRLLPAQSKWRRWTIWVIISATLFYNWLQIILTFVQCSPHRGAWDMSVPSVCWSQNERRANIYTGGVYNVVVDVILAVFPVSLIWNLQMGLKKKVSLGVLLGLGLLAGICAMVKLTYVESLFSMDVTWATYDLNVWSGSELFVVIVCSSIPPSKPLWDKIFPKKRSSSNKSYGYGGHSGAGGGYYGARSTQASKTYPEWKYEMTPTSRAEEGRGSNERILATTHITVQHGQGRM